MTQPQNLSDLKIEERKNLKPTGLYTSKINPRLV